LKFVMTLEALDRTLDFLEKNDAKKPERIDYINYLLGYFVFHNDDLSPAKEEQLLGWLRNAKFTNKSNSRRREMFTDLLAQGKE